ncbi:sulfatase-like hydrolase/transferase [Paenibacillus sp. PL2-23]|uniref:sulfatase-like hydrolase/transferase n=1 Tax=Paenibacillus sp. PL2-23 TaxID=2100729 RepID=UPI0030F56461
MHKSSTKPNIVSILADDMGAWALGCSGNSEIKTPHLDKLAEGGARFDQFYCVSPVCSPARASILTGTIPSRHGVHDWIRSGSVNKSELPNKMSSMSIFHDEHEAEAYLEGQLTYTDLLSQAGYRCALSGKWHLGNSSKPQHGFHHWYTIVRGGCSYMKPDVVEQDEFRIEDGYVTDLITDHAIHFIEELTTTADPFYLSVHYTAPHSPWEHSEHPERYLQMYDDCEFNSVPELPAHPNQIPTCPRGEGDRRRELLQGYYAAITAMDHGIGQIVAKLDEKGIRDNTLIVFMTDNGMNMGHHGIWGKGNGTFPLNMFDTSVKIPAIFHHRGMIPAGQVLRELVSQYDVFPTLLEYAGIELHHHEIGPGRSFAKLMLGTEGNHNEHIVVYDEYGPVRMIRTKEWKYVHRYPYGPHELYQLSRDPEENVNRIQDTSCALTIEDMQLRLGNWFSQYVLPESDGVYAPVTGLGQMKSIRRGRIEAGTFKS